MCGCGKKKRTPEREWSAIDSAANLAYCGVCKAPTIHRDTLMSRPGENNKQEYKLMRQCIECGTEKERSRDLWRPALG